MPSAFLHAPVERDHEQRVVGRPQPAELAAPQPRMAPAYQEQPVVAHGLGPLGERVPDFRDHHSPPLGQMNSGHGSSDHGRPSALPNKSAVQCTARTRLASVSAAAVKETSDSVAAADASKERR